jgi:hypothetical protein
MTPNNRLLVLSLTDTGWSVYEQARKNARNYNWTSLLA